jgi:hypothetical protein
MGLSKPVKGLLYLYLFSYPEVDHLLYIYVTYIIFYSQEHFMEVIPNQEFLMLPADEVAKLLASDDLNVPSEEEIFHVCELYVT